MNTRQTSHALGAFFVSLLLNVEPTIAQTVSWERLNGPYGGAVTSLLANHKGNIYAGTPKGVYRSTNEGDSWTPCAPFTPSPRAFIVDSSGAILAGSTGLWRSTDDGESWEPYGSSNQNIESLLSTGSTIFAGINGRKERGVYRLAPGWLSHGSGTSFNLQGVSFIDANTGTAVGDHGTILRTTDGGATWMSQPSGTIENLADVWLGNADLGVAVGNSGTILRTTDGGMQWLQQTSGTSVHLRGLSFVDTLLGFAVGGGGTIIRTTDGGLTWSSQTSATTRSLIAVSFASSDIGVAVGECGYLDVDGFLLRTTDGGETWIDQSWPYMQALFGAYWIDECTGTVVGSGGVFRTTDRGASWSNQQLPVSTMYRGVSFTDAKNGVVVGGPGVILRTTDGGADWIWQSSVTEEVLNDVFFVDENTCVAVGNHGTIVRLSSENVAFVPHGLSGKTVNSLLFSKNHGLLAAANGPSIYKGSLGDTNWIRVGNLPDQRVHTLVEDISGNLFVGLDIEGAYRSTDGGVSWHKTGLGWPQTVSSILPLSNRKIYASIEPLDFTIKGGIYVSSDGGMTWDSLGLNDWSIYDILALDSSRIFLGSARGVFKSTSGGAAWEVASAGIVAGTTLSVLAVDSATVLAGMDFGVFRSTDRGTTWQESGEGIEPHFVYCLAADSSGNIFGGNIVTPSEGGIFKSTDAGSRWRCTSSDSIAENFAWVQAIIVTPMNTVLAAVESEKWWISRSTDGGETWKPVQGIASPSACAGFALDLAGNIYGLAAGRGLLHSTDDGLTWSYLTSWPTNLTAYNVAARDSGDVYAGGSEGAFRSTDAGNSWAKITASLGAVWVTALAFDAGGELVLSTSKGNVYRTTNGGETWSKDTFPGSGLMVHSLSSKGGNLFAADSSGIFRRLGSISFVEHADADVPQAAGLEQNYPNPFNPSTRIKYTVGGTGGEGRGASNVRLVVYDLLGREVAVLVNERKAPGRYEATFDASGFSSGVFFCRLTAGAFTQTKRMMLVK